MELLQEVANITGKPGLYRIVKPGRVGVIVESLDAAKKREMISANAKVSVLKEISIYTENSNESKPLGEIFQVIKENNPKKLDFDAKNASPKELFEFFGAIMPDFDRERVYPNDIKKIVNWYNTLCEFLPEVFEEEKAK